MPVIGLTDNIAEEFPEIGRLRKGGKKKGNGPGPDLDHFRFTSDRAEIVEAFARAFGPTPRRIGVVLPEATADENFVVWREEWGASLTLKHRCDGEHVVRQWNDETGQYEDFAPGEGPPCPYTAGKKRTKKTPGCQLVGRLRVVIPELLEAGHAGYVTVLTGGKHDVLAMLGVLRRVEKERQKRGHDLCWMPFSLLRVKEEVSSPAWEGEDPGTRHRVVKDMVKLVPAEDYIRAQVALVRAEYAQLPAGVIPAPEDNVPPEVEEVNGEYVAEANEVEPESEEAVESEEAAEGGADIGNLADFKAACKELDITGKQVNAALDGMSAAEWCEVEGEDLASCLMYVRQVVGK